MEIRIHGRGGQGGVTCAKILAAMYAERGYSVQAFGDYASERSGAPVRAYTRVSRTLITNRNKVYRPDHLLVLDHTLLGPDVVDGLAAGGLLVVNTPSAPADIEKDFPGFRVATVDATAIARRHRIGTRSVVIVNTTIAGAFLRAMDIEFSRLVTAYRSLGFLSNLGAAREAFDSVRVGAVPEELPDRASRVGVAPNSAVLPLTDHVEGAPTALKTGSWRNQTPRFMKKLAPCNVFCPAGNDVIGFVQELARDGAVSAAKVLGRTNPLAGVCGRVCPAPCMEGCNRAEYDGAVNIRGLERWVADQVPVAGGPMHWFRYAHYIAIVGGGPAGLSAAYTLARDGHSVTLYEREEQLGGVLRTGIPGYRLPRTVLDREIQCILDLGVEVRRGQTLNQTRLAEMALEYDAVILATGLQRLRSVPIEGASLPGIRQGIHFLRTVNLGGGVGELGHVVVLGGGNTAMDCARSAVRHGATQVTVAYRRSSAEMPAIREEVEQAREEGVEILFLRQPVRFRGEHRLEGLTLAQVELGTPDESGRRRPIVTDQCADLPCDTVLLALGQSADLSLLPDGWELVRDQVHRGRETLPVFAAGDVATGEGTVSHAIGSGQRVAAAVLFHLGHLPDTPLRPERSEAVAASQIRFDHFARFEPAREAHRPVAERRTTFEEVSLGLANNLEAHRFFSCGDCTR